MATPWYRTMYDITYSVRKGRSMQAVVRTEYGGPVHLADVPTPEQVLIDVHAAGLDRGVLHLAEGTPYALRLVFGLRRPKRSVLGLDLAGTVAAVGTEVTRWAVGDEVLGIGVGTFARQAVALDRKLVRKPAGLGFAQAAALPIRPISESSCSGPPAESGLTPCRSPQPAAPRWSPYAARARLSRSKHWGPKRCSTTGPADCPAASM